MFEYLKWITNSLKHFNFQSVLCSDSNTANYDVKTNFEKKSKE